MRRAKWAAALGAVTCAVATAVALSGCTVAPSTAGAPDPGLRGQWVLASGSDTFGPMNLLGQDITLTVTNKAVSTGRNSCSDYTATIYGSQRELWVTTRVPANYSCATADQNVLQLEYLLDLGRIRQSSVTDGGLELSAQGVDLRFTRADPLQLTDLVNKTWQLETRATINLHQPFSFVKEPGATVRFLSTNIVQGHTSCEDVTAHYRREADAIVTDSIRTSSKFGCDLLAYQAGSDLIRAFQGGFTFAVTRNSLALKSTRAGLALGFDEEGSS